MPEVEKSIDFKFNDLPIHAVIRPEMMGQMTVQPLTLKERIFGPVYRFFYEWTGPMIIFSMWIALVVWGHWYINS